MLGRRARWALWLAIVAVVVLLAIKTFVLDVYRVSSASMEPTIHEGEWVAVLHGRGTPVRNELVVVRHEDEILVKRAIGIGGPAGEHLFVDHAGDLWIDGERPQPEEGVVPRVTVFDLDRHAPEDFFQGFTGRAPRWIRGEQGNLEVEPGEDPGARSTLCYQRILRDGYLDMGGRAHPGDLSTHDLVVEGRLRLAARAGTLTVVITEQGDSFEWRLDFSGDTLVLAVLVRVTPEGEEELVRVPVAVDLESWIPLRLANVDNRLEATLGTLHVTHSYQRNSFHPDDENKEGKTFGPRVRLEASGARLALGSLLILRDIQYQPRGAIGSGGVDVGPGQVFLLGDNSRDSRDSRDFGALDVDAVVGRPLFSVWPPNALRRL